MTSRGGKYELTPKQRVFADEWLIDNNGTRAYKVAYPHVKSDSTAAQNASKLRRQTKVQAYIDAKLAERAARYAIQPDNVLKEESRIAFSNIADVFDGWDLIRPDQMPEEVARAVASVKVRTTEQGDTTYEYKFWDKGRALERLSKHLGLYEKDNQQRNPSIDEVYLAFRELSPEVAERVREKLLERL